LVSGISDITSNEGILTRYTGICHLIRHRGLGLIQLKQLARIKLGISSAHTIERHLMIIQKLGFLENRGGIYILTGSGKALVEMAPAFDSQRKLSWEEKSLYFTTMFSSIVRWQLVTFLTAVGSEGVKVKKKIIEDFFGTSYAQKLWSERIVRLNLKRLEKRGIPSFFSNKFGCMEHWLRDLQLVEKRGASLCLTVGCKRVLPELQCSQDLKTKIYRLASLAYEYEASPLVYEENKNLFIATLREAHSKFKGEHDLGDIRAIVPYMCVKLLRSKIILEEHEFDDYVKKMWSEGLVRSVMLGRNGKPAYLVLSR